MSEIVEERPAEISEDAQTPAPHAPAEPVSTTRRLLRRLHGIMAGSGAAQERLDQIVRVVAAEMVAEVCSAYVMRAGEVLELFATEGLRPEAVHCTRLRVGEGLVGRIAASARPLALADAQAHPDFAYRPETGEEIYHSLLGVPVLRGERVLGVLVVQNSTRRQYAEDDVESLQTIAMIVAELIASGELVNPHEMAESRGGAALPMRLGGLRLNPGLAVAPALLHEPNVVIRHIMAEDLEAEERRLHDAVAAMQQGIDQLVDATSGLGPGEHRDIIEAYRMFATDRGWLARMTEAVRSGLTAEAAVQKVRDETKSRLMQVSDPYLRERLYDLEDLANRLQQCLVGPPGAARPGDAAEGPAEFILVAARDGAGRAAGLRASPDQGPRARGRLADDACRDRRAGARHSGRRPGRRGNRASSNRATSSSSTATTAPC